MYNLCSAHLFIKCLFLFLAKVGNVCNIIEVEPNQLSQSCMNKIMIQQCSAYALNNIPNETLAFHQNFLITVEFDVCCFKKKHCFKGVSSYKDTVISYKISHENLPDRLQLNVSTRIGLLEFSPNAFEILSDNRSLALMVQPAQHDVYDVRDETNEKLIQSQFWYLSFFGGSIAISPREIDVVNDIQLLLHVKDNPKTFIVVCSMILLYCMVLVWTRHNDGKDRLQRYVVVLEDNFPGEEWAYLVTVYTGFWIGAGTDANVGFRLYGTKGFSRIHNLQSRQRKVLKTNCDDWFLIFTPRSIGEITKIHVFHDHTGPSTDWYCKEIMVYDLEGQKDFKFIVEQWISLAEEDECVEFFVYPTPTLKSLRRDRIAIDNVIFGLRETHLLLSIFTRHPRSSVTRSQRLSICLCILMVHMLTSIMFYDLEEVEYPQYSTQKRHIIIGMESTLLASPFTFIIIFCFKKSRIVTAPKNDVPMTLTSTQAVPLETGLDVNQSKTVHHASLSAEQSPSKENNSMDRSSSSTLSTSSELEEEEEVVEEHEEIEEGCWKNCYIQMKALLFQVITSKAVMPVKIAEEDEDSSRVRNQWMYFAWILCETAIFVSALFIVIYSLKMDQKKSNEWMSQSFRFSFSNIFLMAPMKIIIFATILAILYGQLQYIPSYECNTEAAIKRGLMGNESYLTKILRTRSCTWYKPLNKKNTLIIRNQEKTWRRWRIIINFAVVILLYVVLTLEVMVTWRGLYIQSQRHVEQMFDSNIIPNKITNFMTYQEYLLDVVLPALNIKTWYNGKELMTPDIWKQEMGYMKDYSARLMGLPRIRQQRVSDDSCSVAPVMATRASQCNAPMTWFNMDEKDYYVRWTQPEKVSTDKNNPWIFSKSNGPLVMCGPETGKCYLPGGYTAKLNYNQTKCKEVLRKLFHDEWFDGLTRVVFFEMAIYNVDTEFICYLSPMLEKLADGSFHFSIKSSILHPRSSSFIPILVILLTFTFYYLFRIIFLFNRKGLKYLISWTALLDIFLNALLYITVVSVSFYRQARIDYLHQWQLRQEKDLQLTSDIFLHRDLIRYETAILVIIIPAQVLHNFRFGKKNLIFFKTWNYCVSFSLSLALISVINYIAFDLIETINNRVTMFCSLSRCYSPLSYFTFTGDYMQLTHLKSFSITFCFVTNILAYLACVISIHGYKESKFRYRYYDDFNMFTFIRERIRYAKRRLSKATGNFARFAGQRFRAGADNCFATEEDTCLRSRPCSYTKQMCDDINSKFDIIIEKLMVLEKTF